MDLPKVWVMHVQKWLFLKRSKLHNEVFLILCVLSMHAWMQAEEVVDKVVKEAISKPWLPLPLGLKPPSTDSVLAELSRQGYCSIPLGNKGSSTPKPRWRVQSTPSKWGCQSHINALLALVIILLISQKISLSGCNYSCRFGWKLRPFTLPRGPHRHTDNSWCLSLSCQMLMVDMIWHAIRSDHNPIHHHLPEQNAKNNIEEKVKLFSTE